MTIPFPYISGFLAFREVPLLSPLIERVRKNHPELFPQIILVDGNGILHPRSFGLACHLGVECDVATVGIAKTFLHVDGLDEHEVRQKLGEIATLKGESRDIVGASGKVWGVAMRTTEAKDGAFKPIYVSAGHKVGLPEAAEVVKRCTKFRIPEPVRQADFLSREFIRTHPHPNTDTHAQTTPQQSADDEVN
eukprot:c1094_g1_i1.p1 GENE.c1094_g1_i1~~c1094_g1_i1.p1  ORF type:complete len:192 (-),score=47.36 c1094_g1_i1:2-577(-)